MVGRTTPSDIRVRVRVGVRLKLFSCELCERSLLYTAIIHRLTLIPNL